MAGTNLPSAPAISNGAASRPCITQFSTWSKVSVTVSPFTAEDLSDGLSHGTSLRPYVRLSASAARRSATVRLSPGWMLSCSPTSTIVAMPAYGFSRANASSASQMSQAEAPALSAFIP